MTGDRLQRIANVLLMNASFLDNPGLLNGKMGIAIFFYHYAKFTGNKIYEDYAGELIDEIYEEISTSTPVNFENGLTGIGWGIEYLVKNGFVKADTDDALSEIDKFVSRSLMSHVLTSENCKDLAGFSFYYPARLGSRYADDKNMTVMEIKQHITFFTGYIKRIFITKEFSDFDFRSLTGNTKISILWFLLETYRLCLCSETIEKVLLGISEYVKPILTNSMNSPVQFKLLFLAKNLIKLMPENHLKMTYRSMLEMGNSNLKEPENDNDVKLRYIDNAWMNLIFNPYLNELNTLQAYLTNSASAIDNEEYWERQLYNLCADNLGLNGITGLGMGILSFDKEMVCSK